MSFTKTTWADDSTPAIDAVQLNRIETGIGDAHDDIDINASGIATNAAAIAAIIAGYDTIVIPIGAFFSATTDGAESGTNEYATNDLDRDYFDFDSGATKKRIGGGFFMPEDWDGGPIKCMALWAGIAGASSGDTCEWAFKFLAAPDDSTIDTAKGTQQVISDVLLANDGTKNQLTGATPAITVGGSPVAGCWVDAEVLRNTDGTDNMAEDARLFGFKLQYKKKTSLQVAW